MSYRHFWDGFDEGIDEAIIRRPHERVIEQVAQQVQRWFPRSNIYLAHRRRVRGQQVGSPDLWPDLQFRHPTRRRTTHIEIDTTRGGMQQHIDDHLLHSSNRRGVFLQVHPRTGDIIRKVVYAANNPNPVISQTRSRRPGTPGLPLLETDVFDPFDD
jgi:hypothetical protein